MIGYKGFDKNFKCKGFQFKVGETYRLDGKIKICEHGFHFCDTPLATFEYYPPSESRYALVETTGKIISDGKHKFCTDELKILKEFTLENFVQEAINTNGESAVIKKDSRSAATNTGNCSAATNTGDWSAATNTGFHSAATNTGFHSAAISIGDKSSAKVTGENSIAIVSGQESKAKGALGCWLVLTEWSDGGIAEVRAVKVDGEQIKADTFYTLKGGKIVEAED